MRLQHDDVVRSLTLGSTPSAGDAVTPALRVETRDGLPIRLVWQGRSLRVLSAFSLQCVEGRWWLDWEHRGMKRRTFRVDLTDGRGASFSADLIQQGAVWKLDKILD